MTSDLRRTLLIDAAIVAVLVVLAFVLAPGVAIVGMAALLVLILGGISLLVSEVRARRRRRRLGARRYAVASGQPSYGPPGAAGRPVSGRAATGSPEAPPVRRVPASRQAQARRRRLH